MSNMKPVTADSIDPSMRAWFGNTIQGLAVRHDVAGPDIGRVNLQDYHKLLIGELRSRALAALEAKTLALAPDTLDVYCGLAAEELTRIRQIKAAHKAGELPVKVLWQLPAYEAFRDYFDDSPSLGFSQVAAAAQELFKPDNRNAGSEPISQPGHPTHPVSKATRAWMELQALGLACADDAWGAPFGTVPQEDYVTDAALRVRDNARRAIRIGDLHVHPEDVDKICWVVACEAYLLRSLKAAKQSGEVSDQEITRMPIYGPYRDYFELGSALGAMAMNLAAAAGLPIPPDKRN